MEDTVNIDKNALEKVSTVFDKVYGEAYKNLMNDDLNDLLDYASATYKGLQLWLELFLFSTASLANSKKKNWKNNKPTDVAKHYLATKYPVEEREEFWSLLKGRLNDLSKTSQSGELEDWMALFFACLASYTPIIQERIEYVVRSIGANKIMLAQGDVTKDFMKLWKKL